MCWSGWRRPSVLGLAALAPFWLGASFAGLPLEAHTEQGVFVYGTPPALQVQDRTTCERNVVALDVVPRRIYRLRGHGIAAVYQRGTIDVASGRTTTTIFAGGDGLATRAAKALRRRGQHRARPLPAPSYPPAVLAELKRADVAVHTPRSLQEIGRALGMGPGVVRARARMASLLPAATLRGVRVPKRSWAQVERDRQIAFAAQVGQAQQQFGLTRQQVRRAVKRVRGLTGRC
jgi:hypothetical protein